MKAEKRVELQAAMVRAAAEGLEKSNTILVDGDLPRNEVLALGGFGYVNPDIADGTFSLDGEKKRSGRWEIIPELTQVGYCRNAAEVLQKLKEKGILHLLTLREFCFYLKNNRDKVKGKLIGLPGVQGKDRGGVRYSAYFFGNGGSWNLHLDGVGYGGGWSESWWFVGVRESAPQGAQD